MIEDEKLRVMSQQGLDDKIAGLPDQTMVIELPAMLKVLETGLPQRVSVSTSKDKLFSSAHTQMVIPIRRETAVIGLLHLESSSDFPGGYDLSHPSYRSCGHCHFQCATVR